MTLQKGDKVVISNNSVFKMMGFDVVHGEVFLIYPAHPGFAFKCKETGHMETADLDDGQIEKL